MKNNSTVWRKGQSPFYTSGKIKARLHSLRDRIHGLDISVIKPIVRVEDIDEGLRKTAKKIVAARRINKAVILMIGGHVIRSGVQRYLIDLLEKNYITCVAMNGACVIHDYEFALIGATTESVSNYISDGRFGFWQETGCINDIVNGAYKESVSGMGHAIGKAIFNGTFPYKCISILASCFRLEIPATVHVGIGYDIIHQHPNFNGAATGDMSYRDFLKFTESVLNLENGVVMNFGSAVMAPEIFLKALSLARNIAKQSGHEIKKFTSLVSDLHNLPKEFAKEPSKENAYYYFRPWKTMLIRAVRDGGESFYVKGFHAKTIPSLWSAIEELEKT